MSFTMAMAALLIGGQIPAPTQTPALRCPHTAGFIDRAFVPNPEIAVAIYKAVRLGIGNGPNERFPEIEVTDEGDYWQVMENRTPVPPRDPMTKEFGGGQLYMRIDKCTGAISNAAYNR